MNRVGSSILCIHSRGWPSLTGLRAKAWRAGEHGRIKARGKSVIRIWGEGQGGLVVQ